MRYCGEGERELNNGCKGNKIFLILKYLLTQWEIQLHKEYKGQIDKSKIKYRLKSPDCVNLCVYVCVFTYLYRNTALKKLPSSLSPEADPEKRIRMQVVAGCWMEWGWGREGTNNGHGRSKRAEEKKPSKGAILGQIS